MGQFDAFINHAVGSWGYYAVFGMLAAEGFGLFFVPGETTLLAAAIVAGATHRLGIVFVLLAGYAGALLGDNFSYLVGHRLGFGLIRRYGPYVRLNQKRIKFVQVLYLRYGVPIVFVGRFIMLLRSWESFLAGANRMPWRRFAPVNAAASLVWVCVWGLGAYALGEAGVAMLKTVGLALLGIFCLAFVAAWLYFRRHERDMEAWADRALPGPLKPHRPQDVKPVS
ncbi:MAG TPA: DedA family protein [Stellaceae bacterium]|nr:DedA family protein [Stellaceae bacterium]